MNYFENKLFPNMTLSKVMCGNNNNQNCIDNNQLFIYKNT